jgi:hypothetical protein
MLLAAASFATSGMDRSNEIYDLHPDEEYGPIVKMALVQLEMLQPQDTERHIATI